MPFAINEATRFISPTKTPEYLAAARPVVSTPVTDVVRHYGHLSTVRLARGSHEFVEACASSMKVGGGPNSSDPEGLGLAPAVGRARRNAGNTGGHPPEAVRRGCGGRRFRGRHIGGTPRSGLGSAGARDRPASSRRRQRLRSLRCRRHPGPQIRSAYLPHEQPGRGGLPVAVHTLASLRAPGARKCRRQARPDADQPDNLESGVRPVARHRGRGGRLPRSARRAD